MCWTHVGLTHTFLYPLQKNTIQSATAPFPTSTRTILPSLDRIDIQNMSQLPVTRSTTPDYQHRQNVENTHSPQTCHTFYDKSARRSAEGKVQTILISPYESITRQTLQKYKTTLCSLGTSELPNSTRVSILTAEKQANAEAKVNDCKRFTLSKGGVWFLSSSDACSTNTLSQSLLQA